MPKRIGAAADGRGLVRGPDRAHVDHVREFSGVQAPQLMEWSALFIDRTHSDDVVDAPAVSGWPEGHAQTQRPRHLHDGGEARIAFAR